LALVMEKAQGSIPYPATKQQAISNYYEKND
jgi:hypothetical protein